MMARKPAAAVAAQLIDGRSVDLAALPTVETLRRNARIAFEAAYGRANAPHAGDDWQRVNERWQELNRNVLAARQMQEGANANSAADHAGRSNERHALIDAIAWFDSYQPPKALKPIVNHSLVRVHHANGCAGEHWLETRDRLEREREMAEHAKGAAP